MVIEKNKGNNSLEIVDRIIGSNHRISLTFSPLSPASVTNNNAVPSRRTHSHSVIKQKTVNLWKASSFTNLFSCLK